MSTIHDFGSGPITARGLLAGYQAILKATEKYRQAKKEMAMGREDYWQWKRTYLDSRKIACEHFKKGAIGFNHLVRGFYGPAPENGFVDIFWSWLNQYGLNFDGVKTIYMNGVRMLGEKITLNAFKLNSACPVDIDDMKFGIPAGMVAVYKKSGYSVHAAPDILHIRDTIAISFKECLDQRKLQEYWEKKNFLVKTAKKSIVVHSPSYLLATIGLRRILIETSHLEEFIEKMPSCMRVMLRA